MPFIPQLTSRFIMCVCGKLLQLYSSLCEPMDCSPSDSSVHGILQARILKWIATPSSRGSSRPQDSTRISMSPALAGGFFTTSATWEAQVYHIPSQITNGIFYVWMCVCTQMCVYHAKSCDLVAKSCLTLATPWTVACQASLFMGFSRQEYWSR